MQFRSSLQCLFLHLHRQARHLNCLECNKLEIDPEKCSEQAVLGKYCLGPREACKLPTDVKVDTPLIPLFAGIAMAFVAGIIYV